MKNSLKRLLCCGCAAGALVAAPWCARAAGTNMPPAGADAALRDPFVSPFAPPPTPAAPALAPTLAAAPVPSAPPVAAPNFAAELRRALHVQGYVQQGGHCYAMINGRLVSVGDVVQVRLGATTRRFRVQTVTATSVNFEPLP
jgi:hypothetical protein